MAPFQISNATPTLKKVIVGTVKDNLKSNALAWYLAGGAMPQSRKDQPYQMPKRLNSSVIDWANNSATIPVRLSRHAGIYGVTESDNTLPTPGGPGINAATVSAKYITGTFRITLQSMQVREGSGAVVSLMKENVRSLSIDYIHDMNRQFFGNATGAIARAASNTAGNSTTLTLSKPIFGVAATSSNGDIDFADYFPVGSTVKVGSVTAAVTAVGANELTVSPGILTAADTVSKANEAGTASAELDGLAVMVAGSGTAYLSLTNSGWVAARSTSQAAGSNTLTEAMLDTVFIAAGKAGRPDVFIMNQTLWRKYASLLASNKRYTGRETYYGGTPGLEYAGGNAVVLLDYDCPDDAAYVLSTEDLQLLQWKDFDLEDGTEGKALRVPGTLNYEIVGSWFGNIATGVRRAHAVTFNMVG